MASASIPVSKFQASDLPPICVSSGIPAANVFSVRVGRVTGGIPLNGTVVGVITRIQKLSKLAFAFGMGVFFIGLFMADPSVTGAALLPLGIAFGLLVMARMRLPVMRIKGDQLQMGRAHPAFVSALTKPPGKCSDCTGASSCSVAEMEACDGDGNHTYAQGPKSGPNSIPNS